MAFIPNIQGIRITGSLTGITSISASTISSSTLTVSAATNPVTFIGLTADTSDTRLLSVNTSGVIHTYPISGLTTAITSTNIYNSNGTLTGNRVVNLSSYTLNFSSATNPNTLVLSGGVVTAGPVNWNRGRLGVSTNTTKTGSSINTLTLSTTEDGVSVYPQQLNFIYEGAAEGWSIQSVNQGVIQTQLLLNKSGGNVGINTTSALTALHVSSGSNPLTLEGVQEQDDAEVLSINVNGVVHKKPIFLKNNASNSTETIISRQSIFNPADLTVRLGTTFTIEALATYYILGDLYNNGTTIVNGTLKVGGAIYNSGTITGSGIIE
jgi:hypothetical protein